MSSCDQPTVDNDELYSPPSPPKVNNENETRNDSNPNIHTSDAYRLRHDDFVSLMTTRMESKDKVIRELISTIYKPNGEVDYRAWLRSGIPLPDSTVQSHLTRQLRFAKVAAAHFHVAKAVLLCKCSPLPVKEALEEKAQILERMISYAHRAIDTAVLLKRPDFEARAYYYLAIAAEEEGNVEQAESYFERALEDSESWEGRNAAEALGIDIGDGEDTSKEHIGSQSTMSGGEKSFDIIKDGQTTSSPPAKSLEDELMDAEEW